MAAVSNPRLVSPRARTLASITGWMAVLIVLGGGGPCGDQNTVNNGQCPAEYELVIEQGTEAALPNICTSASAVDFWDTSRWKVTLFDFPLPLAPRVAEPSVERPKYVIGAPATMGLGPYEGSISVQIIGSECVAPSGETTDCVQQVRIKIRVVEPGSIPLLTVRIDVAADDRVAPDADGRMTLGKTAQLTAVVAPASASVTYAWEALRLVSIDGERGPDRAVHGKTDMVVTTGTVADLATVYRVTATETGSGTMASAYVTLRAKTSVPLRPRQTQGVPTYPGSPYYVEFEFENDGLSRGVAWLQRVVGSQSWTAEERRVFIADESAQARATWETVGPENRALGCLLDVMPPSCGVSDNLSIVTFVPTAEQMPTIGVLRVVIHGHLALRDATFAHTFVRAYD